MTERNDDDDDFKARLMATGRVANFKPDGRPVPDVGRVLCRHHFALQLCMVCRDDAAQLVARVAALNPSAGEIGAGMLASLVEEARRITPLQEPK